MNTRQYDPSKPLISIHVPKSGGSSVSEVLRFWFGDRFFRHEHDEERNLPPKRHPLLEKSPAGDTPYGLCIHGHFDSGRGIGVGDYYPEANQLIAFLRDPFEAHLSNYFYIRRLAAGNRTAYLSGQRHPILENNWNLEDYLANRRNSYICRFLPEDLTEDNYRRVLDETFLFIGTTENLQASVDALADILGFGQTPVPAINASPWTESIPDGAREEFERNNPLETAIYTYVKEAWRSRNPPR